jgi:2-enoate reductase
MQAAVAAAREGCSVTLFEKEKQLGGLVRTISSLPNLRLSDLQYAIDDLRAQIETLPIELRLSTNFALSQAFTENPDLIVMAAGSIPALSQAAPQSPDISLSYVDFLNGKRPGRRVLVDGHGEGAEFAVSLARGGHQVVLVEQSNRLQATAYDYARKRVFALVDYLADENVETHWDSRVKSVQHNKVEIESERGVIVTDVDSVLVAGRTSLRLAEAEAGPLTTKIIEIGDCVSPRGIGEAMEEGRRIAEMV